MRSCVIFGGTGFVGTHLSRHLIENDIFQKVYIGDIVKPQERIHNNIVYEYVDVRESIDDFLNLKPSWIFNLAAIHREPGHDSNEYFDTNINGANNVVEYAENVRCNNLYFTSSISVYGPCIQPTSESKLPSPITPYGASKYPAELIHQNWLIRDINDRRLIIVRPGVIYGPGDPGNIMRMIKAVKKGYFFFPGNKNINKSYGYIYGLIDSVEFTMNKNDHLIIYNYVETPTESISDLVNHVIKFLGRNATVISIPKWILLPISKLFQIVSKNNPIHPVRVKKASFATHIIPQYLIDNNFNFRFYFYSSLEHWKKTSPEDFEF